MSKHFFVLMYGTNEFEKDITDFHSYEKVEDAQKVVNGWLEQACGMECIPYGQEDRVRSTHDGHLPETAFLCPEMKSPADLAKYNGFYDYEGIGVFNLFLTPVYDHTTAVKFRGGMIKEFGIDQEFSDRADELMELLDLFVAAFDDDTLDDSRAEEAMRGFLTQGGFSPFGSGVDSPEFSVIGDRDLPDGPLGKAGFDPSFGV